MLVAWLAAGPLAAGWARRAGTPASILAKVRRRPSTSTPASTAAPTAPPGVGALPATPFTAQLTGTLTQSNPTSDGQVTVRLATTLSGGATGVARRRPHRPAAQRRRRAALDRARSRLGPVGQPSVYRGTVTCLRGHPHRRRRCSARGPTRRCELTVDVQIAPSGTTLTGTVARPDRVSGVGQ